MYRKRTKRSPRRRKILIVVTIVLIAAVGLGLVGAYIRSGSEARPPYAIGSVVPQNLYSAFSSVARGPYGPVNLTFVQFFSAYTGKPYLDGGKPIIVFVGAEACSLCAAQRWPLIMALMRFGDFTGLHLMASVRNPQSSEVDTFTFFGSTYSSNYIELQGVELFDRTGQTLTSLPSTYAGDWQRLNQTVPYLNFGDRYLLRGNFPPTLLEGKNWTQIVNMISSGDPVGREIQQLANGMTSAICTVDGGFPSQVCTAPAVSGFALIGLGAPEGQLITMLPHNSSSPTGTDLGLFARTAIQGYEKT